MAILFDLDGTLLDTAPDFVYAVNLLQSRNKKSLSPLNTLRPFISDGINGLIQVAFGYNLNHPQNAVLAQELLKIYEANVCRYTQPFPGIISLLTHLEKVQIPWGIVTNKYSYLTEIIVNELDLKNRAACIVSGDTTPFAKPHPAPLLHACKLLDIQPDSCVYIGDAERDIKAGKACGMTTITALFGYINNYEAAMQWGADHHVHQVEELLPFIQEWKKTKKLYDEKI